MKITVKLFAVHRELAGEAEISLDLSDGDNVIVADALEQLFKRYPGLEKLRDETIVSINKNFAELDNRLSDGDELAVFPPVSGG